MVSQLPLMCGRLAARKNCQTLCRGARPRYNLVVDEDVKKPSKQTNKQAVTERERRRDGETERERERGKKERETEKEEAGEREKGKRLLRGSKKTEEDWR